MDTLKKAMTRAGAVGLVFFLSGCSALSWAGVGGNEPKPKAPEAPSVAQIAAQPLRPGDRIIITSWRADGVSDTLSVDENGSVVLPLLGRQNVTGLPSDEFKPKLVQDYEARFRNHTVGVTLQRRVSVLGAVEDPGIYYVDPTMAVADALALAGGPSADGKRDEVFIQQAESGLRIPVQRQSLLLAHAGSGDQIVVPQRHWLSRNALFIIGTTVSAAALVLTRVVF